MPVIIGCIVSMIGLLYSMSRLRDAGIAAVPTILVSLYCLTSVLVYQQFIYSEYAKIWSNYGALYHGDRNIYYFSAIVILYVVALSLMHRRMSMASKNLHEFVRSVTQKNLIVVGSVILIFTFLHIMVLDIASVMSSSDYLFLASSRALKVVSPETILIQSIYKYVGVLAYIFLALAITSRRLTAIALLTIPCLWFLTYEIVGHSRFSVVYMGIISVALYTSKRHKLAIIFAALAVLAFNNSLAGRSSGVHGLSYLSESFLNAVNFDLMEFMRFYTNMFEGVFVQGEVFYYADLEHESIYKILSFSPFPSAIDEFKSNALQAAIRFHFRVPMGATGEVLLFGSGYFIIYWSTIFLCYLSIMQLAVERRFFLFFTFMFLFLLCTYLQFAYPVRWVYRFFIFMLIVSIALPAKRRTLSVSSRMIT